jgi:hypothetical protein
MIVVTWNMQGSNVHEGMKWNAYILQYFNTNRGLSADVVCLQEAGAVPESARPSPPPPWVGGPPVGWNGGYYLWNNSYFILWLQTDPNGNRVNLAIVSKIQPDGLVCAAPGLPGGRPALGYWLSGQNVPFVFTIHGFSGNGNDDPGLISNIHGTVPAGNRWIAAGDYNREPNIWNAPVGRIIPPNTFTLPRSRKEYDYAVILNGGPAQGIVHQGFESDHYPVQFSNL